MTPFTDYSEPSLLFEKLTPDMRPASDGNISRQRAKFARATVDLWQADIGQVDVLIVANEANRASSIKTKIVAILLWYN